MTLVVLCPLRVEAAVFRGTGLRVVRTGMGRDRALAARDRWRSRLEEAAVVVAGFCGAVDPRLSAGDVVVATELRASEGARSCSPGLALEERLRNAGLRVYAGPIFSADRVVGPAERSGLHDVLAVDMESYWLAEAAGERGAAVVRVVVDEAGRRLLDPRTLVAGVRALASLRRAASVIARSAVPPLPEPLRY